MAVSQSKHSTFIEPLVIGLENYDRLPQPSETFVEWKDGSGAEDTYKDNPESRRGKLAVSHAVKIVPPLKRADYLTAAVEIVGGQNIASYKDPSAPRKPTHEQLREAGVPFDSVEVNIRAEMYSP